MDQLFYQQQHSQIANCEIDTSRFEEGLEQVEMVVVVEEEDWQEEEGEVEGVEDEAVAVAVDEVAVSEVEGVAAVLVREVADAKMKACVRA